MDSPSTPTRRASLTSAQRAHRARVIRRRTGPPSTSFSQDPPWLRRRERISLVKNRMREICTSGSARDGDGNVPIYSALGVPNRHQIPPERGWFMKVAVRGEKVQLPSGERLPQIVQ